MKPFFPLQQAIETRSTYLGQGIIKVDSFITHQLDGRLLLQCANKLIDEAARLNFNKILTAEMSGIAPAVLMGAVLGMPVVVARKHESLTMTGPIFRSTSKSHTHGNEMDLIVSREFMDQGDRVLIIDDFLACGVTIASLAQIVSMAGATLAGIGVLIEKGYEGGRASLEYLKVPIFSLINILGIDYDAIIFAEEKGE